MTEKGTAQTHRFFAAANSAGGFKNYFDDIFPSESLDSVFILKGGPGTGKSTLLREAANRFDRPNIQVEVFHCSSDPSSLDGVILRSEGHSACILDGTAPHERDARLPGAADEIINLGECFDTKSLRAKKAEILSLQRKKGLAYKEAYFYLGLFSIFADKIKAETESRLKKDTIKEWARLHFQQKTRTDRHADFAVRPIRAFCKDGIVALDSYEKIAKETIFICGDAMECAVLISAIHAILCKEGNSGYYSPSPLLPELLDGLLFNNFNTAVTISKKPDRSGVSASDFFSQRDLEAEEKAKEYTAEAERYLTAAKGALASASAHHFALERIYTPAMRFDRLNHIKEALFERIADTLALGEIS